MGTIYICSVQEKLSDFYSLLLQFVNDCATAYDEEGEGEFNLELIGLKEYIIILYF